jgi:hypothetical protein
MTNINNNHNPLLSKYANDILISSKSAAFYIEQGEKHVELIKNLKDGSEEKREAAIQKLDFFNKKLEIEIKIMENILEQLNEFDN